MINDIAQQLKSSLVTHLDIIIHLYYSANSCSTTKGKADKYLMPGPRSSRDACLPPQNAGTQRVCFLSEMMMAA